MEGTADVIWLINTWGSLSVGSLWVLCEGCSAKDVVVFEIETGSSTDAMRPMQKLMLMLTLIETLT